MTNNKNNQQNKEPQVSEPENELNQLRQIVFGEAQKDLIAQIATLRSDMEQAIESQTKMFTATYNKMQESTEKQFLEIEHRIQHIDQTHDNNEVDLQKEISQLASEHEIFATATQQDFKNIELSLNNESSALSNNFNERIEQLKTHLEDVSKELSSSKTDRKTLARLLATMATNLEDEQI